MKYINAMYKLPVYSTRELIQQRLSLIFPEGTPNRGYCTRELAASTVFVMLYIGAVEGTDTFLGPVHVYRMTVEQAALVEDEERLAYKKNALGRNFLPSGERWYADNTREPIRDETLREGLVGIGAVGALSNLATTSSKPRYFLKKDFAALFDPHLPAQTLEEAIKQWQQNNLSKSALTRLSLAALAGRNDEDEVLITYPNRETRSLSYGDSSVMSKAVIEVFAHKFLERPAVLWLSTSGKKVVSRDDKIAASIGLNIQSDKVLPDIILVDLAPNDPLLVFVEVVATDGPVTERRQEAIYDLTDQAGFKRSQVAFVTAYADRGASAFRKTFQAIGWNSFAWFVSEPEKIIWLKDENGYLSAMIGRK